MAEITSDTPSADIPDRLPDIKLLSLTREGNVLLGTIAGGGTLQVNLEATQLEVKTNTQDLEDILNAAIDLPGAVRPAKVIMLGADDAGAVAALGVDATTKALLAHIASDPTFQDTLLNAYVTRPVMDDQLMAFRATIGVAESSPFTGNPKVPVTVKALSTNTGIVYVGPVGVLTTTGFPLNAGEAKTYRVDDLSLLSFIGSAAGQDIAIST